MKVDILHLLPSLSEAGGTPRKVRDLILRSSFRHAVYCWTRWELQHNGNAANNVFDGSAISVFKGPDRGNIFVHLFNILKVIQRHDVKLVHGYFESGLILCAIIKLLMPRAFVIVSFVGFPASYSIFRRVIIALSGIFVDKIVYVSEFTRSSYQRKYQSFKKLPGIVIYNGVNPRGPKSFCDWSKSSIRAVTISGLVEWKNILLLLKIIKYRKEHGLYSMYLQIIGDGPERKSLEKYAVDQGISESIEFLGYTQDVGQILAQSDLYLHPALSEGFGIAVIEAMRANLPVILADSGALPELVEAGNSGFLVDGHDVEGWSFIIDRLHRDINLARSVAEAGCKRAERLFGLERYVGEHDALYLEFVGNTRLHSAF